MFVIRLLIDYYHTNIGMLRRNFGVMFIALYLMQLVDRLSVRKLPNIPRPIIGWLIGYSLVSAIVVCFICVVFLIIACIIAALLRAYRCSGDGGVSLREWVLSENYSLHKYEYLKARGRKRR
jgi:hypothetical protein